MKKAKNAPIKIWYQSPVPFPEKAEAVDACRKRVLTSIARDGVKVDIKWLKEGATGTYPYDLAYNTRYIVERVYEAEKKGYHGVIIGCFGDPGLTEARSIVNIPVMGLCESALLLACCLGAKFSIITDHRATVGRLVRLVQVYGLTDRLAKVLSLGLPSTEIIDFFKSDKLGQLVQIFKESAEKTIRADSAEVIIPGCALISAALTDQGVHEIKGVPVVDPIVAAVKMVEVFVDMQRNLGTEVCRATLYSARPDWEKDIPPVCIQEG